MQTKLNGGAEIAEGRRIIKHSSRREKAKRETRKDSFVNINQREKFVWQTWKTHTSASYRLIAKSYKYSNELTRKFARKSARTRNLTRKSRSLSNRASNAAVSIRKHARENERIQISERIVRQSGRAVFENRPLRSINLRECDYYCREWKKSFGEILI